MSEVVPLLVASHGVYGEVSELTEEVRGPTSAATAGEVAAWEKKKA